ncbi:unnamed protein product, partial [Allacma fusca]
PVCEFNPRSEFRATDAPPLKERGSPVCEFNPRSEFN